MKKIGFGMIGCGTISDPHLQALHARADAELICVADMNEAKAKAQAEKYHAKKYVTNYLDLLDMSEVQAVIVGIPTKFHADAVIKAAECGKHILCEKPMARTLAECNAMINAANTHKVILQIGFVRRFDPVWGKVRELTLTGKVGRPCLWRRIVAGSSPQPPSGAWYSDSRFSDGPLAESACHDFDFVRYTFGDAEAVTASVWQMGRTGDVLDTGSVIVDFKSGDQMLCFWSWGLPPRCAPSVGGLDVIGPDGVISEPIKEGEDWVAVVKGYGAKEERFSFKMDLVNSWFAGQLENFIKSIRGEQTPRATVDDGLKAHEITLAAFESSKTGRRIEL